VLPDVPREAPHDRSRRCRAVPARGARRPRRNCQQDVEAPVGAVHGGDSENTGVEISRPQTVGRAGPAGNQAEGLRNPHRLTKRGDGHPDFRCPVGAEQTAVNSLLECGKVEGLNLQALGRVFLNSVQSLEQDFVSHRTRAMMSDRLTEIGDLRYEV